MLLDRAELGPRCSRVLTDDEGLVNEPGQGIHISRRMIQANVSEVSDLERHDYVCSTCLLPFVTRSNDRDSFELQALNEVCRHVGSTSVHVCASVNTHY
jgi:hypothetical protein